MSSSTLFKIAGGLFLAFPLGHTQMYLNVLVPHLQPLAAIPGAYASKVSWIQANGYFITTGTSNFCPWNVPKAWVIKSMWSLP